MLPKPAAITTCALQSGSNGNCIYVETPDARLLVDAGISGRSVSQRLAQHDRDLADVDAVLISHNHRDHICGAGVIHRRHAIPLYITAGAWSAARSVLGVVTEPRHFEPGQTLHFGQTTVDTVPTAHDGIEGVAFVVTYAHKRLGIFTDLGHRFVGIDKWIAQLDAVYLESNYDPAMLAEGPYPAWLKKRIAGDGGHLSNGDAASLIKESCHALKLVVLAHLSEHNNHPDIALATARAAIGESLPLAVASRSAATGMFTVA